MTISFATDTWRIFCIFKYANSSTSESPNTCHVNRIIDGEEYVIASPTISAIDRFELKNNKEVKYLPSHIGEKFPNLKEFDVRNCSLTVIRNKYFKKMRNLQYLILNHNNIATVESDAFKDLVSVKRLELDYNMIQTLDKNLFTSMVKLVDINLKDNKIKFLSPETFKISGGSLEIVGLPRNVCINQNYISNVNLNELESDLEDSCSENSKPISTEGKLVFKIYCIYEFINLICYSQIKRMCYAFSTHTFRNIWSEKSSCATQIKTLTAKITIFSKLQCTTVLNTFLSPTRL